MEFPTRRPLQVIPTCDRSDDSNPTLHVRSPKDADDREVVYSFPDDDPYDPPGVMLTTDTLQSFPLSLMPSNHLHEIRR